MKKNVAIIVSSLTGGGAERVAGYLSVQLAEKYNIYLIVTSSETITYDYKGTLVNIREYMEEEGLFYHEALRGLKDKYSIDCAISFLEPCNFANIQSAGDELVLISERCAQSPTCRPVMGHRVRELYPYADGVISCAEGVRFDLINNYGLKADEVKTIYNFIDVKGIQTKADTELDGDIKKFLGNNKYFVAIGRLAPQKNHIRLIKQFKLLKDENPDNGVKLIIKGSGELEEELQNLITDLDLSKEVKILSYSSSSFQLLKNAEAFVLASRFEGLPNVVLEAFAVGCPVIASDCLSGPRELLDDDKDYSKKYLENRIGKRGILCPDVETDNDGKTRFLADAMELVLNDDYLRSEFITKEREYIDNYNQDELLNGWINAIEATPKKARNMGDVDTKSLDYAERIYIYGAGMVGHFFYERLKGKYKIEAFIVSNKEDVKDDVIPIITPEERDLSQGAAVIVGVGYKYHEEIYNKLISLNCKKIVFLN
ncbi:MAG: glycosyltransferase [Pseudobutyrivibrio sp.]|nr:glycosyltransferase [Pseudobutyrivibrio sp.]